jgi:hypothetical protein
MGNIDESSGRIEWSEKSLHTASLLEPTPIGAFSLPGRRGCPESSARRSARRVATRAYAGEQTPLLAPTLAIVFRPPSHQTMSRRAAITDASIVLTVAAAYIVMESCRVPKRWSYSLVAVLFVAFGMFVWRQRTDTWHELGFRSDNLREAVLPIAVTSVLFSAALAVWAFTLHRPLWSKQSTLLLALYPVWALVQQGVFQGVLHRRLAFLWPSGWAPVVITALAFSSVHWGNGLLVALTLCAGLAWSTLYRFWPNIWLLAASHSVLAALAYPAVLGDAPLSRF